MSDNDFMKGYRPDPPLARPFPDRASTAAYWVKGQTSVMAPMLCCPECGSKRIGPRDNNDSTMTEGWQCHECASRFKLPRGTAAIVTRGYTSE